MKNKAQSVARLIKPLAEVDQTWIDPVGNRPTPTAVAVRMLDGAPMRYFSDGSLRHLTGFKPGKAARKAAKRARRKQR